MDNDGAEFYPLKLKRREITGKGGIEFSINAKGSHLFDN
jgi:hypothetical protein